MTAACPLVPMPSLSRYRSFAVPRLIAIVFARRRSPLPPNRMSNELVKTAPANRSSVKPLQSVPVSCRHRIGCRRCPRWLPVSLRHVPPSSCLLAALSSASLIRLVLSPRRACRASVRLLVSSYVSLFAPSCLSVGHVRLVPSAHPLRPLGSLCLLSPFLVSRGGALCVPPAVLACLPAVLRSAHPRVAVADILALLTVGGAAADIIAPFLRSVATVPPLPRLALSPRLFVSGGGEMPGGRAGSGATFFLWDFCAIVGLSYRACAIMYAVAMGTSEWEAFVPRSHMLHLLTRDVVRLLLLINTTSPLLLYTRRSSLLNRPAFLYDRRGDFFCRFHMGSLRPVPAYPSRRASSVLLLHGTPLVMSSVIALSPRSSSRPTAPHRPSPRLSTRRAGRGACLVLRCLSCPHAVV